MNDSDLIAQIAERSVKMWPLHGVPMTLIGAAVVVGLVHEECCKLDLAGLLAARDFDFAHDIFGMCRHYDPATGTLKDGFLPRYAVMEETEARLNLMEGGLG